MIYFKALISFAAKSEYVLSLFLVLALTCFNATAAGAASLEDRLDRIQNAYDSVRDVKGNFIQKNIIKELKRTDTYKGNFYIKPPRIKWEYVGDKAQTIYIDGENIILHHKKEKQVIRSKFDRETYGQTPFAFLTGLGNIREEFDASEGAGGVIILKPKKEMGNIVRIEIKMSSGNFPVKAITLYDKFSNVNAITFSNVKINNGLKDSFFRFIAPKDVAVMER